WRRTGGEPLVQLRTLIKLANELAGSVAIRLATSARQSPRNFGLWGTTNLSDDGHLEEQGATNRLRLSRSCSGALEVFENGSWVAVSLRPFKGPEEKNITAQQICRSLSCGKFVKFTENTTAPINTCLTECIIRNLTLHNCTAAVLAKCSMLEVECEHQAVRLVDGGDRCAGRVELMDAGLWGSVCDDNFTSMAGHVVCSQLSCGTVVEVIGEAGKFPPGTGPIHISRLNCSGTESNLWQCRTQDQVDRNYCGHKEDVGVVCSGSNTTAVNQTTTAEPNQTAWATVPVTEVLVKDSSSLSAPVWGCIILSVLLFLVLLSNAALCKHYKRRNACEIHQRHRHSHAREDENINSIRAVTARPVTIQTTVYDSEPRRPSLQTESETSSDSNYQPYYNYCIQSPVDENDLHTLNAPVVDACSQAQESCSLENALKPKPECDVLDSSSTSSGECYENTEIEQNPVGNEFHPEQSLQMAPLFNTSQSTNSHPAEPSDSDSTSSGECYENVGMEAENFVQTLMENPSLPEQTPLRHPTPQPTENSSLLTPGSPNQDDSSSSSDDDYENVPDIDEDCHSSSSSDYDDVANW
ncbi:T-cell differentiation antigen CD6-like, partial [Hoplias malabaricus]|uniref:T-cell differentiation antigen CD6-like n=1 Tax=Hoplias malabaricus TaxID=27720 RepID=UPI003462D6D3